MTSSNLSTQTPHESDQQATTTQPELFESRRMSGGSRSAPSQSTSKPFLSSSESVSFTPPSAVAAYEPSASDHTPDEVTLSSKDEANPQTDSHPATSPFVNPQSPIRRVVRAANKSRRRLQAASAESFTLEAIQRRLNIFRDPTSPQGTNPASNDVGYGPPNIPVSTSSASTNRTAVSKNSTTHSRPTSSCFPASPNTPQVISPFSPSQLHAQRPHSVPTSQTHLVSHHQRRKTGSRRKQDLPPRPVPNTSPRLATQNPSESVGVEENICSPRPLVSTPALPRARPTSMSGMSNEKEFENASRQLSSTQHVELDCHLPNDLHSTSKANSNAETSFTTPNTTTDFVAFQQEQPNLPRLNSRRRSETREMLLSFPEHDAATVHKLMAHFKGDHKRVHDMLTKAREQHQQQQHQHQQQSKGNQEGKKIEHSNYGNVGQQQALKPPMLLPPLPQSQDSSHRKDEHSRTTRSEASGTSVRSHQKPQNGFVFSPGSRKQSQIIGVKRRRGDSRDESNGKVAGSDTRFQGFVQIQSPIPNFFPVQESATNRTNGKPKSRLHLRSRLRRARAGKFHCNADTEGDVEQDPNLIDIPPSVVTLPKSENCEGFGDSSQDDTNKCDRSHESDTSTSSNTVVTTETVCSGPASTQADVEKVYDVRSRIEAWERVQALQKIVSKLEQRLAEVEDGNRRTRQRISCRLDAAMRDMSTIEKRHEGLCNEVDDNIIRVGKTEQYLDAMRRDLLLIVGQRQWAVWRIVRTAINNVLYYFLAYLVPILAFVVRLIRDVVVSIRRYRLPSST